MKWSPNVGADGEHDSENCYGCKNYARNLHFLKKSQIIYSSVNSVQMTIPHTNIPVPEPNSTPPDAQFPSPAFTEFTTDFSVASSHEVYQPSLSGTAAASVNTPILISQEKLEEIVAHLELSKKKSEMLASWLKSGNLLAHGVKVTGFRNRQVEIQKLYKVSEDKKLAWCSDINELMKLMNIQPYDPNDWRLFMDANIASLKALLLDTYNKFPAIPIAYCTDTKETYEKMDSILKKVDYKRHNWKICCDLKVVDILCGLQAGYTKHMCFLCEWDSRYKKTSQYDKRDWKLRSNHIIGQKNVEKRALVLKEKVLMPPLHIKLGVVQSFVKTINKRPEVLKVLMDIFPGLTKDIKEKVPGSNLKKIRKEPKEKLVLGVLNGPDIRRLKKSPEFDQVLQGEEKKCLERDKRIN